MSDLYCESPQNLNEIQDWITSEERIVYRMLVEALSPLAGRGVRSLHSLIYNRLDVFEPIPFEHVNM